MDATKDIAAACMETLAERVHLLRRRERRSQKDLACLIGSSPTTISNLEQGKLTGISFEHLIALAAHFEVSLDYLVGFEPKPKKEPHE